MTSEDHTDFYQKLRKKVKAWEEKERNRSHRWAEWLLLAPDMFHLLIRLAADPEVPIQQKGKLAAVIAYFISPIDLMPEIILGPTGFLDDICLAAYALNAIINEVDEEVVTRHWAGEDDILAVVQNILILADKMLGSGLFKRLKRVVK